MSIDNLKLFDISLKNKESYLDEYYIKDTDLVITSDKQKFNALMESNSKILDNISAYKIAVEAKNISMQKEIIENINKILKTSGINNSEFTSYWSLKDMSYSSFKSFKDTPFIQKEFLKKVIPEYINDRHGVYRNHGYSFSTLQAIKDSKAHKSNGNSGNSKVTKLLEDSGFSYYLDNDLDGFIKSDKVFIYPDKKDKSLFKKILNHYGASFDWSKNHENKQTDFLFKVNGIIYIMEHKHMKESGGGQDKQMSEIINFISYKDKNVSYVAFLDGIYFNVLSDINIKNGKPFEQRKSIIENLKKNKQNYFVNTRGFISLMASFK